MTITTNKNRKIKELQEESNQKTRMLDGLLKENMRLRQIIVKNKIKVD